MWTDDEIRQIFEGLGLEGATHSIAPIDVAFLKLAELPCSLVQFGGGYHGCKLDVPSKLVLRSYGGAFMFVGFARYHADWKADHGMHERCKTDCRNGHTTPILGPRR